MTTKRVVKKAPGQKPGPNGKSVPDSATLLMAAVVKNVDDLQSILRRQVTVMEALGENADRNQREMVQLRRDLRSLLRDRPEDGETGPHDRIEAAPPMSAARMRNAENCVSAAPLLSLDATNRYLIENLSVLEEAVESLSKRLFPVLRADCNQTDRIGVPVPEPKCPYSETLMGSGVRVGHLRATIDNLLDRLEI